MTNKRADMESLMFDILIEQERIKSKEGYIPDSIVKRYCELFPQDKDEIIERCREWNDDITELLIDKDEQR